MTVGEWSILIGCLAGAVIFGWREGRYRKGWKDGARYERDRLSAPEHRYYLVTVRYEHDDGSTRHCEFSTCLPAPVGMPEWNNAIEQARRDIGLSKRPVIVQALEIDYR